MIILVPKSQKEVIEAACSAIHEQYLIKLTYKNQKGEEGEKTIRPYMIIP
ncbi:MAG: hypothetical protein ICV66_08880, partial [Chitinophagaceae bacterium]|nr:hypothetical protein [Chitinophagaceae bacterium]